MKKPGKGSAKGWLAAILVMGAIGAVLPNDTKDNLIETETGNTPIESIVDEMPQAEPDEFQLSDELVAEPQEQTDTAAENAEPAVTKPVDTEPEEATPSVDEPAQPSTTTESTPPQKEEKSFGEPAKTERTVYITDTGSKYHRIGCRYLDQSQHEVSYDYAVANGYVACKVCKPR